MFFYILVLVLLAALRFYSILPSSRPKRDSLNRDTRTLAVFLGSGGHTSEALSMISGLDFTRYPFRTYIVSDGDTLSADKAIQLETSKSSSPESYRILVVPRARRVHQSLLTTLPSAIVSVLKCTYYVSTISPPQIRSLGSGSSRLPVRPAFADVLILNGPGTCLSLCIAVYFTRFLGIPSPRLIYIESFTRVTSLSLSGRLLRRFVDRFIVQWPQLLKDRGRGENHGWLV